MGAKHVPGDSVGREPVPGRASAAMPPMRRWRAGERFLPGWGPGRLVRICFSARVGGVAMGRRAPGHVRMGVPGNLPAELSTFVGRADDLERGTRLLRESRLVTFTGAGGCGKTRLARQVAARVAERFPGGVWWVELASLADGALVTDRVARTLGLQAGETEAVVDYFADSTALVLLDNCEHIVEGVAQFVTAV